MSKKELYPRLAKMPYYRTSVSAERTKAEIISLLEKYGIESHQWTKLEGKETLKFIMDTVVQGTQIKQAVLFEIPTIKALTGQRNKIVEVPQSQSYRIFFYALKSLLESTKFGLLKKEDLFMSYTLTQLPNGEIVQMKDFLRENQPLLAQGGLFDE
jgi:hypothetical protein